MIKPIKIEHRLGVKALFKQHYKHMFISKAINTTSQTTEQKQQLFLKIIWAAFEKVNNQTINDVFSVQAPPTYMGRTIKLHTCFISYYSQLGQIFKTLKF